MHRWPAGSPPRPHPHPHPALENQGSLRGGAVEGLREDLPPSPLQVSPQPASCCAPNFSIVSSFLGIALSRPSRTIHSVQVSREHGAFTAQLKPPSSRKASLIAAARGVSLVALHWPSVFRGPAPHAKRALRKHPTQPSLRLRSSDEAAVGHAESSGAGTRARPSPHQPGHCPGCHAARFTIRLFQ